MNNFEPGIYKHFKGGMYKALFVARSSEDDSQEFVVYQDVDELEKVWIRPLEMFLEHVDRDGYKGPRFSRLENNT